MCREINLHFIFSNIFLFFSYFISISASGSRVTLSVCQREVNGTEHQSVLLPVSYSTLTPYSTLTIEWRLFAGYTPFVRVMRNCSQDPDRSGYNCSDHRVTAPSYRERVHLYPENGSLLLRDLQLTDSGVYLITVYSKGNTSSKGNVTLTVYPRTGGEIPTLSSTEHWETTREFTHQWPALFLRVTIFVGVSVLGTALYLRVSRRYREN